MFKKCLKTFAVCASVLMALGCTEKIYELVKRDFGNELSILKSSTGDRFTECETALTDRSLCLQYFFKELKDCDDYKVFMSDSTEEDSEKKQIEKKIKRLKNRKPSRSNFDNRDDYLDALEDYEDDLEELEDDLNDLSGGDQVKIKKEYEAQCHRELEEVNYICGINTTLNSELVSAIETTMFKIHNEAHQELHDHCDMEWKPYRQ